MFLLKYKYISIFLLIILVSSCAILDNKFCFNIINDYHRKKIEYLSLPLFSNKVRKYSTSKIITYLNNNVNLSSAKNLGNIKLNYNSNCSADICKFIKNQDGSSIFFYKIYMNLINNKNNQDIKKSVDLLIRTKINSINKIILIRKNNISDVYKLNNLYIFVFFGDFIKLTYDPIRDIFLNTNFFWESINYYIIVTENIFYNNNVLYPDINSYHIFKQYNKEVIDIYSYLNIENSIIGIKYPGLLFFNKYIYKTKFCGKFFIKKIIF